jgi:hypothetical protein
MYATFNRYGSDATQQSNLNKNHVFLLSKYRHTTNSTQHSGIFNDCLANCTKKIPFEFTLKLPAPLRTGIDYGFRKGENWGWRNAEE